MHSERSYQKIVRSVISEPKPLSDIPLFIWILLLLSSRSQSATPSIGGSQSSAPQPSATPAAATETTTPTPDAPSAASAEKTPAAAAPAAGGAAAAAAAAATAADDDKDAPKIQLSDLQSILSNMSGGSVLHYTVLELGYNRYEYVSFRIYRTNFFVRTGQNWKKYRNSDVSDWSFCPQRSDMSED